MSTITESVDVAVPVTTVYNQWTQFEEFPKFMEGVEEVVQLTETKTHWKVEIAGVKREFDAEITTQDPDRAISWESVDGPYQSGAVAFQPMDGGTTRVTLKIDTEPEGFAEKASDATGLIKRRVKGDVERFKEFIESQGTSDGAWRGQIKNNKVQKLT